jgi:hypothetical protein
LKLPRAQAFNATGAGLLMFAYCAAASAGVLNEVPSCYKASQLTAMLSPPAREIFIVIDQTTILDDDLKSSLLENVRHFLGPDSAYTVVAFSAFSQDRYTEIVSTGTIEPPFPAKERDSTSERLLKTLDACLQKQGPWAKDRVSKDIAKTLVASSPDLARSDILGALHDISSRIEASPARDKVLLMVSDMLENSSISSFYAHGGRVRKIDPDRELVLAQKADTVGVLHNVRVDVLGAGLLSPTADRRSSYRDPQTLSALHEFWKRYFENSGAVLEQFGEPALLQPIK